MKKSYLDTLNQQLRFQRNCFVALCFLLAATAALLSIFLFGKNERIVVVPPVVEKEFWVEDKRVSPSYLEQYAYFLAQILFGKSSHSAPQQREIALRHVAPEFAGGIKKKLLDEEELLIKQNASYTFFPVHVQLNPKTNEVLIEGDRVFYVSGKQVSSEREGYILSFRYSAGKLLLTGITSKESKEGSCAR